jgi:hypothetical protein
MASSMDLILFSLRSLSSRWAGGSEQSSHLQSKKKLLLKVLLAFCVFCYATQVCNGYFLSFFDVTESVDGEAPNVCMPMLVVVTPSKAR